MDTKVLAGAGIAALAITSGNQARRHQRQNGGKSKKERNPRRLRPPPVKVQSSDVYHNETAELAASISSYAYGRPMPGYMT